MAGAEGHFRLDDLPPGLATDEAMDQAEVERYIFEVHGARSSKTTDQVWNRLPRTTVPLSRLKKLATSQRLSRKEEAVGLMKRRTAVSVDDDMMVEPDDPHLSWHGDTHYLDYVLCVPRTQGLPAVLPPVVSMHNYPLEFMLNQPNKEFKGDGLVGFETSGRVAFFGKYGLEQLWVGFAPNEFFAEVYDEKLAPPSSKYNVKKGDSRLTPSRFKIFNLFVVHWLARIRYSNIALAEHLRYGTHVELHQWSIDQICNIL